MKTYDEWKATEPTYNEDGLTPEEQALEDHESELEAESLRRQNNPVGVITSPEEQAAVWPAEDKRCPTCGRNDAGPCGTRCHECIKAAFRGGWS